MFNSRRHYEYEPIGENHSQHLYNENFEKTSTIYGYCTCKWKNALYHFLGLVFLGIPYVLINISKRSKTLILRKSSLQSATILLVIDNHTSNFVKIDEKIILPNSEDEIEFRYFVHQHTKYVWDLEDQIFVPLCGFFQKSTIDEYLDNNEGLKVGEYEILLKLYGENRIDVEIKSYWVLFVEEVFHPFYMFQLFSVILWVVDDYVIYASCVVVLTLFSSVTSLVQTRKQSEALRDLVESSKCHHVQVLRQNLSSEDIVHDVDPVELVPGDLIIIPSANFIMPCDAVLLTGQCIVNESVLTGESVPVTKTVPYSCQEIYHTNHHKRHTLFAGTTVIQTRYYGGEHVLARVVRTGFDTTKGALVKSILFPAPVNLQFYKDSFKFVFVLFTVAASGMVYCLYLYMERGAEVKEIVLRTLDIITIVVPPALPAAMTVGTIYSQNRLKELGIFCISPPRINICGKIKLACFDKTGTLTDDGLRMYCVVPSTESAFIEPVTEVCELNVKCHLIQGMATCHSLTRIENQLNGDPLDLNMFEFTKWELEEPGEEENERFEILSPTVVRPGKKCAKQILNDEASEIPYQIGIIRQFPFSSTQQCMSVICHDLETSGMVAFTKGAPEKLQGMCLPETLPPDFSTVLSEYTTKGLRVIAIAYKILPKKFKWKDAQTSKRDLIECDLNFLGLIVMQNPLKPETIPVIQTLHLANVRTVMITGDNILTAVSVARECGMVKPHDKVVILSVEHSEEEDSFPKLSLQQLGDIGRTGDTAIYFDDKHYHLAIDGRTWSKLKGYYQDLIPKLLVRSTVFARFQPDQKTQLITDFQSLDYIVSMVGDGANDCGALKAAHVGVSLSQAEASVAAPFTSKISNISCIIHLMLEGRCALVTSFAIFKYMALYSLIQFFTIVILYYNHSILGDYQFLFIDLVITTTLAVTIGRQGPAKKLCPQRPMSSLVSPKNVIPLLLQIFLCALFQLGALWYLDQQKWFEPIHIESADEVVVSWENTVLFTVSCYQYMILAVVFSKGKPHRERLIKNSVFLLCVISLAVFTTWMMIYPCKVLADIMDLMYPKHDEHEQNLFRYKLIAFPLLHLFIAALIEMTTSDKIWFKKFLQCVSCKRKPKNKYKRLLNDSSFFQQLTSMIKHD